MSPLGCRLGMLDTYASQAVGAGNYANLGSLWRQCVGWLLLHTLPVAAVFASVPAALACLGQPAELRALLRPYLLTLLPAVWTDAVYRCGAAQPWVWRNNLQAMPDVGTTLLAGLQ